jgi:cytochrome c biogenesis protein CcmG/thiol:disulfide interchange protein DsbE
MWKIFRNLSLFLIIGCTVYIVIVSEEPLEGYQQRPMPPLSLDALEGGEVSTAQWALLENGPKVVNLFASWCTPCIEELPVLEKLNDHVPVYGIAFKDSRADLQAWLDKHGNPYKQVGIDKGLTFMWDLGVTAVPTTLLLDASNKIIFLHEGKVTEAMIEKEFLPRLKALANE